MNNFSLIVEKVKSHSSAIIRESRSMIAFIEKQTDPSVLSQCKAQAAAIAAYLAHRKDGSVEEYNTAIKIKLRVEHRLGEVLKVTVNHVGNKGSFGGNKVLPPTLPDEITKMQSSRAQRLADLLWSKVEETIDGLTGKNKKASASWVVKSLQQEAEKEKVADLARIAGERAEVTLVDHLEFLRSIPVESADLLLTDPPYMTDVKDIESFAAEWVPLALSRLKKTGRAYICTGAYPQELAAYLAADTLDFTLANVLVWTYRNTLGPSPLLDYKLNWQAIFYLRGPDAPALNSPKMTEQFSVQDINAPDARMGDRFHTWQKPDELAERFIRHSTEEGQLVIDPFVGTGTFLLVAARLQRKAKGSEVDPMMLEIAEKRGCLVSDFYAAVG